MCTCAASTSSGNTRTRDEVVRREFRQFESSWYDGRKIKLSRDRVDRLGYFSDVTVDSNEVPGTQDQVDLTIAVKEKQTGNLLLGAGFSSAEKLSLNASIKQDNVFGSGNYLGIELNTSKYSRTLVLSTVDPYFTIDGISRAIDIFYRTQRPLNSQGEEYKLVTPERHDPFRRAVQRVRHGVLRHRFRAHRDQGHGPAEQLLSLHRAVRQRQQFRAASRSAGRATAATARSCPTTVG